MASAPSRKPLSRDRLALCQDRRRAEALQRQRDARRNLADHARALAAPEPEAPRMDVDATLSKAELKRRRADREAKERAAKWSLEPDLNGKGDAHGGGWYVVPRPEGKRCLVAVAGQDRVEAPHGDVLHRWRSAVPSGSPQTATKDDQATVLECVFYEPSSTYFVVDVMTWGGYSLYDCTAEFRFYWLRTKLGELEPPEEAAPYALAPAPYFDADGDGVLAAHGGPLPYLRDGLLFYAKQGHYALGPTPLVALFKDAACTRYFAPTTTRARGRGAAAFDRRCSNKRALPDSASKIAFALRHKTRPLGIADVVAVARGNGAG
ncbi:hypothetical protein JL720_7878 [Aureococcus anophagefferens]|nr:hypothetical protein JL720_7878 [Aureococcus anophagefferens]